MAKEKIEILDNDKNDKKKKDAELANQTEIAFMNEEAQAIRDEHSELIKTKRIIDKVALAPPEKVNQEVCELLCNYRGIILASNYNFLLCIKKNYEPFFSFVQDILEILPEIPVSTMMPSNL